MSPKISERGNFQLEVSSNAKAKFRGWKRNNYALLIHYSFRLFSDLFITNLKFLRIFLVHYCVHLLFMQVLFDNFKCNACA